MKKLTAVLFLLFLTLTLSAQVDIMDMCLVLKLDAAEKTDLRKAAFMTPFDMGRTDSGEQPPSVTYYMIDLPASENADGKLMKGMEVIGIRPYKKDVALEELLATIADDEIAMMISPWPEREFGPRDSKYVAMFVSKNGTEVSTDHLIVKKDVMLPDPLISMLDLPFDRLAPGIYPIFKKEF